MLFLVFASYFWQYYCFCKVTTVLCPQLNLQMYGSKILAREGSFFTEQYFISSGFISIVKVKYIQPNIVYFHNSTVIKLRLRIEASGFALNQMLFVKYMDINCMRQIFCSAFRALKISAAEIGSSPKQFTEKIATLLKAIQFHRGGCDPSTMLFLAKIYFNTHKHTLPHSQTQTHNEYIKCLIQGSGLWLHFVLWMQDVICFLFALRFFKQKLTCLPHLFLTCFHGASWVDFIDPGKAETQSSHNYLQQYFNLAHPAVTCSN